MQITLISIIFILSGVIVSQEKSAPAYTYKGGWPVNPRSDEIADPGFELPCPGPIGCECTSNADCYNKNCNSHPRGSFCAPKAGDLMPRFEALDQFGESVDLYDFAHQGKLTLLEISAAWCTPCNNFASWLTTNDLQIQERKWWKDQYLPIRDMIHNGEIQLINIMYEGKEKKTTVTPEDVVEWYTKYPDPNVPVLADEYLFMHSWVKPTGLPCIFLLDENMRLVNYTSRGLTDAFLYLTKPGKK